MNLNFKYKAAGDSSILLELDAEINERTNKQIIDFANLIEQETTDTFGEVIIGYRTILIQYNPIQLSFQQAVGKLKNIEKTRESSGSKERRHIEIPVYYGDELGPDLESVAKHNNLTPEQVITTHSEAKYVVYFLGFTPGFPFMGGMSKKIATPRLESPRTSIASGSVGIANDQTGIYPVESPGGWRLIGQTPLRLYNFQNKQPFLLRPGDYVTFKPIQRDEFNDIKRKFEVDY